MVVFETVFKTKSLFTQNLSEKYVYVKSDLFDNENNRNMGHLARYRSNSLFFVCFQFD